MTPRSRWFVIAAFVTVLCAAALHAKSAPMGAIAPAAADTPSHGWAVIERRGGPHLVHVPPREPILGAAAADAGVIRPVRGLAEWPDALAAINDRVYLFYPATPATDEGSSWRPVFSLRAVPSAIAGMWVDLPSGLLDSLPALPANGRLIGVAAHERTLHALERSPARLALWSLDTERASAGWREVDLPEQLRASEPRDVAIASHADGVIIAIQRAEDSAAYIVEPTGEIRELAIRDWPLFWGAYWRAGFGRELLAAAPEDASANNTSEPLTLTRIGAAGSTAMASLADAGAGAILVLPSPGRLVLVRKSESGGESAPITPISTFEMSLLTGRVLHDGPGGSSVAVPVSELRAITVLLVLMMATVLIVIIRPDPGHAWSIPEACSLADPGRRLIASIFDLVLVAMILAPAFGVSARQILTLEVLIHPGGVWLSLPATAVAGWISMSVWEALLGLTPGKLVTGCRVRRSIPGPPVRVSLFWCLVRNAMKWLTPPIAALALFDPEGRHRGDAAAGAVVVTPSPGTPIES